MSLVFSQTYTKEEISNIFKEKMLPEDFNDMELPAINLSLTQIKEKQEHQFDRARLALFSKFKTLYGSENLETLQETSENLASMFDNYADLRHFIRNSDQYLPISFNELDYESVFQAYSSNFANKTD